MDELREACAEVARRATHVHVHRDAIDAYARTLTVAGPPAEADETPPGARSGREARAAFWLTLDAINFGSGWFPTLRKRGTLSGYNTIAAALRDHVAASGPWDATGLTRLDARQLAQILGQDPRHELMRLYAASLIDLGVHVRDDHGGSFTALIDSAAGSAVGLATALGRWACFADCDRYGELRLPFLKRAQIAAADLQCAGAARWTDLPRLTMFADNLVPHVLRLDGILEFEPGLVARIERAELIEHGSAEEVEIRACALHAVELLVAAADPGATAAAVDQQLWQRGQGAAYKRRPRHRSRCTAY